MKEIIEKAKKIQCLICDVDGVLTDGRLYDGVGLKLLMAAGIEVAIITTSRNAVIDHRMQQLGIRHYYMGQLDKRAAYLQLKSQLNLNDEVFAYIGDDLPDLPIIRQVGLGVAVVIEVNG